MLHFDVEFCAAVLNVVMCFCMWCSVVTCCILLLNFVQRVKCCDVFMSAVQYFHMLHCVVEFFAAVFHVVMGSCMLCSVVTYYQMLL